MTSLLRFLLPALFLFGCSTDLEINAPYKNITIVYGLMSTKDASDVHFVKINKAFLGDGDAFVFAQVRDSNEYRNDELLARVEQLSNGQVVNTWTLNDTVITDREPGTFYSPDQTLYYFTAVLDEASEYRIVCDVKGEQITARTAIVNNFSIQSADANPNITINLKVSNGYADWELNWSTGRYGKRYETYYRFNYGEVRGVGDTTWVSITRLMGVNTAAGDITDNVNESMNASLVGEDFFRGIGNLVVEDPTVIKRVYKGIDFLFEVAGEDFHTYLTLANPTTGIVEERPDFTNVTNGYGLFSSRYSKQVIGKRLSNDSVDELVNGQYTGTLRFCSPYTFTPGLGCN